MSMFPVTKPGKHGDLIERQQNLAIFVGTRRCFVIHQAPVVQRLDNAIHQINRYPADKC